MVTYLKSPSIIIRVARFLEDPNGARMDGPHKHYIKKAERLIDLIIEGLEDGDVS